MSEYKITDNDIKALKFRDELIELLNKYNYELSGDCFDDGDIEICSLNEGGGQYIIENNGYYSLYDYNKNKNIMEIYLLKKIESINNSLNRINTDNNFIRCGIVTSNERKANNLLNVIIDNNEDKGIKLLNKRIREDYFEAIFSDNSRYVWVKPSENVGRGQRFNKLYIDSRIRYDFLEEIIMPMLIKYDVKNSIVLI